MFNEDLYDEEILLEKEARGITIARYRRQLSQGLIDGTLTETDAGQFLLRAYIHPLSEAVSDFVEKTMEAKRGRRARAAPLLAEATPEVAAFIFLKILINKLASSPTRPTSVTSVALAAARTLEQELTLQAFDKQFQKLSSVIEKDFEKRDLPRRKREEYLRDVLRRTDVQRTSWTKPEQLSVGMVLLDLFIQVTGDVEVITTRKNKRTTKQLLPRPSFLQAVERRAEAMESLFTLYYPTVIPPRDWGIETLELGGYWSHNVMGYSLVKYAPSSYRRLLSSQVKAGELTEVLDAVNAVQRTPWAINLPVLEAVRFVYERNISCGKLPASTPIEPDAPPFDLTKLPRDHPDAKEYRRYRAMVHEENRRIIAKRLGAVRAFQVAEKFSKYERIYFPHDLDSRGRAYPKPGGLNPQGPDYIKGLLKFSEGRPLGPTGIKWLGLHGANSWGADKLLMDERFAWAKDHLELARAVRDDPQGCLEWAKADQPVQFLAWCLEWANAHDLADPSEFLSHLHVDLDATCSGLQHFSAMLRDEVGGFHVNMTRTAERQDVYGAVASEAEASLKDDLDGDQRSLAEAWQSFGIDRSITKRPVMVKPYSGTFRSCLQYVEESTLEKVTKENLDDPFPEMRKFAVYGAKVVWAAIPKIVVAADGAMQWLTDVTRLVAKADPVGQRIEWKTPLGFVVWQSKRRKRSRRVKTRLEGQLYQPRLSEDLPQVDVRKMLSSVPPSFVHSLDAAHLHLTVSNATREGLNAFAVVHDSFGVHACDAERFSQIIRESFVELYEREDVLESFLKSATSLVSEELHELFPEVPPKGTLDLKDVLENEFFFS